MAFLGPIPLYWPFMDQCRCGKNVDELGLHGLSCTKNAGHYPRHSAINSILKRSLTRIGLKRPDGLTLGPWYRDRSMEWDATVVDTFAQGHNKDSARQAGFAATKAEGCKMPKISRPPKQLPLSTSGN